MTKLQPALDYFGSPAKIAQAVGLNVEAVRQWTKRGIPPLRAIELSELSNGAFKASDLLEKLKGVQ